MNAMSRPAGAVSRRGVGRVLGSVRGAVLLILVLPLLLASCFVESQPGIVIWNDMSDPVDIVYLKDGEMPGGRLEPGVTKTFPFDLSQPGRTEDESCTTADIVARSLDGKVIAIMPPPLCIKVTSRQLSYWLVH